MTDAALCGKLNVQPDLPPLNVPRLTIFTFHSLSLSFASLPNPYIHPYRIKQRQGHDYTAAKWQTRPSVPRIRSRVISDDQHTYSSRQQDWTTSCSVERCSASL